MYLINNHINILLKKKQIILKFPEILYSMDKINLRNEITLLILNLMLS